VCDELLVINEGQIVASGSPHQVITEKMLSDVFGVCAQVSVHPQSVEQPIPHVTYFYGYQTEAPHASEK
jgi:iron complex transport system ATP-binding protein